MDEPVSALKRRLVSLEAQLARRLEILERGQKALEAAMDAQASAFEAAVKDVLTAPVSTAWRFDARMPNTISDKLSLPERDLNGAWMRWFLGGAIWRIDLSLAPRRQYDVIIVAPKFHSDALRHGFFVRANGQDLEWLRTNGSEHATTFDLGDEKSLTLVLAVASDVAVRTDALFAISSIELKAR